MKPYFNYLRAGASNKQTGTILKYTEFAKKPPKTQRLVTTRKGYVSLCHMEAAVVVAL